MYVEQSNSTFKTIINTAPVDFSITLLCHWMSFLFRVPLSVMNTTTEIIICLVGCTINAVTQFTGS